jgi:uncharacterized Zn finger protein
MITTQTRPEILLHQSPLGSHPNKGGDMERVTGAACTSCGCEESEVVSQSRWWGEAVERLRCANCGVIYTAKVVEKIAPAKSVVKYIRMRCPGCGSKNVRTTSTRGTIRWHKCGDCEKSFQSVED